MKNETKNKTKSSKKTNFKLGTLLCRTPTFTPAFKNVRYRVKNKRARLMSSGLQMREKTLKYLHKGIVGGEKVVIKQGMHCARLAVIIATAVEWKKPPVFWAACCYLCHSFAQNTLRNRSVRDMPQKRGYFACGLLPHPRSHTLHSVEKATSFRIKTSCGKLCSWAVSFVERGNPTGASGLQRRNSDSL
jgi:hypothetical protein